MQGDFSVTMSLREELLGIQRGTVGTVTGGCTVSPDFSALRAVG